MGVFSKSLFIYYLFTILFIECFANASSTQNPWFFKRITTNEGLSQASVNCFLEDPFGFMWIGTDDGLNRFDGNSFTIFDIGEDGNGLSNGTIQDLKMDGDGNIWIATADGLNMYDLHKEVFIHYKDSTINNFYSGIVIDESNQRVWLASNAGGLKYLDRSTNEIHDVESFTNKESLVWKIIQLNEEQLLIATLRSGVYSLNIKSMDIQPYLNDTSASSIELPGNRVRAILKWQDQLIFAIQGHGILICNPESGSSRLFSEKSHGLSSNSIYSIWLNRDDLFVGTDGGGLNCINLQDEEVSAYQFDESNLRGISSNVVRSIYTDKDDNIWVGTYNGGVNFVNSLSTSIEFYGKQILNPNSLSHKTVTSLELSSNGGLWIGTDGGGLNYLMDGKFSSINKGISDEHLNDNVVMCLEETDNGTLAIGTFTGGLNLLRNGKVNKYKHEEGNTKSISNDWIWSIKKDRRGNLWIGTNDGLNKFDPKSETFSVYKPTESFTYMYSINNIRTLFIDSNENLWVGSFGGFGKFNINSEEFEYFINSGDGDNDLKNDIIVKVFEDSKSNIWLGTYGGGLSLFNEKDMTFRTYTEGDGLPSNHIQSIEEDSDGFLWISTILGLVKFGPDKESFAILDVSYGLQSDIFKHNASTMDSDGNLFFGGINGFNKFHPDQIEFPEISNNVVLTECQIFNKTIKPHPDGILKESVLFSDEISMSYEDSRFFSIHFTNPSFSVPDKLRFAYKLEGFDSEWNYIENERKATFTNLNPRDYELRLKVSSSNIWPEEYTAVKLSIVPPFYMRRSFIGVSLFLAMISVFGIFRYRTFTLTKRQKKLERLVDEQNSEITKQNMALSQQNVRLISTQKELEIMNQSLEEKVKKRTEKLKETVDKLNKSVSELDRFVYSASHDLSAPLKSIQGLINIARIENKDQNLSVHLDYIEKSIFKLESAIKDLIQFSRNSRAELKFAEINLFNLIREIIDSLKFMPGYEGLKFNIAVPQDDLVISDSQRLQMVLENLFSNAIKYQDLEKKDRHVEIRYKKMRANWQLEIHDNGIGISEDHVKGVFDMFYRATELSTGTGLGLFIVKEAIDKLKGKIKLASRLSEGSTFTINLPINPES